MFIIMLRTFYHQEFMIWMLLCQLIFVYILYRLIIMVLVILLDDICTYKILIFTKHFRLLFTFVFHIFRNRELMIWMLLSWCFRFLYVLRHTGCDFYLSKISVSSFIIWNKQNYHCNISKCSIMKRFMKANSWLKLYHCSKCYKHYQ